MGRVSKSAFSGFTSRFRHYNSVLESPRIIISVVDQKSQSRSYTGAQRPKRMKEITFVITGGHCRQMVETAYHRTLKYNKNQLAFWGSHGRYIPIKTLASCIKRPSLSKPHRQLGGRLANRHWCFSLQGRQMTYQLDLREAIGKINHGVIQFQPVLWGLELPDRCNRSLSRSDEQRLREMRIQVERMLVSGHSYVELQWDLIKNHVTGVAEAVAPLRGIKRNRLLPWWTSRVGKSVNWSMLDWRRKCRRGSCVAWKEEAFGLE